MSLRDTLRTAGRVGYQVLDNIIGFDDDYDTTGELLARSLRQDPLGTAGSIASGMYQGAKGAVTQPVQTAREIADQFADAYLRLREGLPEDATRDDIGQLTEDLTLFGSLVPPVGMAARTARAVTRAAPDPWSNVDFDDGSESLRGPMTEAEEAELEAELDRIFGPADAQAAALAEQQLEQQLARREALISAFGGEEQYQNALRGWFDMDPTDNVEAAQNLADFTVLERAVFDPEDGPMPQQFSLNELAAMNPDAVRSLLAEIENDPSGYVYSPELAEMLADMTQEELAYLTGLPIPTYAGAWNPNLPPPPAEIDFGPTIEQLAAGADNPFGDVNPWTNVQDAEDLAENFQWDVNDVPGDPFSSTYGAPVPDMGHNSLLFSPATRAAVNLEQPRYGSADEVISNLRRQGATSMEIDLLRDQGVFDKLSSEADLTGAIEKDSIIEAVGSAPRLNRSDYTVGQGARYMRYFPPGAENYRETVFSFAQQPRSYSKPYFQSHFEEVPNAAFHMRTGEFPVDEGGRAFHLGEVQSDLGRNLRDIARDERDFNRPLNVSPLEWQLGIEQRLSASREEHARLLDEIDRLRQEPDLTPSQEEELRLLQDQATRADRDVFQAQRVLRSIDLEGDAFQEFGLPTYGSANIGSEVTGPVPIARDTNDYTTAALARAFSDAVESGADYLTFNTGDMMHRFSGGQLSGQRKAYDDILLRNAEAYAQRLSDEYGIDPPKIERVTIQGLGEKFNVPGIPLRPELRALVQTQGLPSYKDGGIVSLLHN